MKTISNNPNFCVMPFIGMCIEAGGRNKPCCKYKEWNSSPLATESSLQELTESDVFKRLRQEFLNGEKPEGCRRCWKDEAANIPSFRESCNRQYGESFEEDDLTLPKVKVLDFGFGNTCNAACITCESSSSSLWIKDDQYLETLDNNKFERQIFKHSKDSFPWKKSDYEGLRHIIHAQNEVMLSPSFKSYMQTLSESKSISECKILLSTNSSYFPSEEVLSCLKKFKKAHIQLSIDGFGIKNEYIRYPLKWKDVSRHAEAWLKQSQGLPNMVISMRVTISTYNVLYLKELSSWWKSIGGEYTSYGYAWHPSYLNPGIYPSQIKKVIIQELSPGSTEYKLLDHRLFSSDEGQASLFDKFLDFTQKMDVRRKTDVKNVFPELFSLLDAGGFVKNE